MSVTDLVVNPQEQEESVNVLHLSSNLSALKAGGSRHWYNLLEGNFAVTNALPEKCENPTTIWHLQKIPARWSREKEVQRCPHRIACNSLFGRPITKMAPMPHTFLYPFPKSLCGSFQQEMELISQPLESGLASDQIGQWNMVEVTMCQFQVLASGALASSHLFSWTPATNMRTSLAWFAAG